MQKATITITADAVPFLSALESVSEVVDVPLELGRSVVHLIESGTQAFRLELNGSTAAGTGHLRITLQPSDSLLKLVSTLRALDLNGSIAD